ncbi:MAG: DUF2188 domain-containing protein [Myxococcota bacterium]|nr:DUF2188 domain-containing protein [Myxococcota bacterium]
MSNNRSVYHVVPFDDLWAVKLAGDSLNEYADNKDIAVTRAKELARRSTLGQVVVHGRDGKIEQEFYFGEEPSRAPR